MGAIPQTSPSISVGLRRERRGLRRICHSKMITWLPQTMKRRLPIASALSENNDPRTEGRQNEQRNEMDLP